MSEFIHYLVTIALYACNQLSEAITVPELRLTAYIFVLVVVAIVFLFMFILVCQLFKFITSLFRRF